MADSAQDQVPPPSPSPPPTTPTEREAPVSAPTDDTPQPPPPAAMPDAIDHPTNTPSDDFDPTTLIDESRATTPPVPSLPVPMPSFMDNRLSTAPSNSDSFPSFANGGGELNHFDSQTPLTQPKPETSSLKDEGQQQREVQSDDSQLSNQKRKRTPLFFFIGGVALLLIAAIILGVYFGIRNHKHNASTSTGSSGSSGASTSASGSGPQGRASVVYGGDGTVVTTEQGTNFTYSNKFGGYFVTDSSNPFTNNARAQSWSPPLNQSWNWGTDRILGVNLGGWLVMEPFITPSYYQKYTNAIDEWTLSTEMAKDTASGGLNQLEEHYKTFITEEDFAQIAGAGLNWIRLPIAFWAIDTWEGEPFLAKTSWKYALKAFDWARKYGLRIMLDLHATPGSQNGYNHSGQFGKINLLNGVMGLANAQRLLHYIRIITEFISQPQYKDVVVMFGIVNEPAGMPIEPLAHFYIEAHRMIRNITGVGAGNGPFLSIQGGNFDLPTLKGSDRIALEQHPYFAFSGDGSTDITPFITRPCSSWGDLMDKTKFGVTTGGEWSLGFNDCGLMLHSTADQHTTTGCAEWDEWEKYTDVQKGNLMNFAMSSMDVLQDWFFWTWKIGNSSVDNSPRSPLWSYKLGVDNGWIPKNPRDAFGHCASAGAAVSTFTGPYPAYQTGGGDGVINAADLAQYGSWPPPSIGLVDNVADLPTYTATGPVPTLPPQSYPAPTPAAVSSVDVGDGWYNSADTASGAVTVAGCAYPNAWDATGVAVPAAKCTGAAARKRDTGRLPVVTQAPA